MAIQQLNVWDANYKEYSFSDTEAVKVAASSFEHAQDKLRRWLNKAGMPSALIVGMAKAGTSQIIVEGKC